MDVTVLSFASEKVNDRMMRQIKNHLSYIINALFTASVKDKDTDTVGKRFGIVSGQKIIVILAQIFFLPVSVQIVSDIQSQVVPEHILKTVLACHIEGCPVEIGRAHV